MKGLPDIRFDIWGAEPRELDRKLDCDSHISDVDQVLVRAVDVQAPVSRSWLWLLQLRRAPYSYDLIDNLGRKSPGELEPGLEELEVGQKFMTIFRLVDFEANRSLTLDHRGPAFGRVVVTYLAEPVTETTSRIFVRMLVKKPSNPLGAALSFALPAGDLVMMRKQLLNLRDLAEANP